MNNTIDKFYMDEKDRNFLFYGLREGIQSIPNYILSFVKDDKIFLIEFIADNYPAWEISNYTIKEITKTYEACLTMGYQFHKDHFKEWLEISRCQKCLNELDPNDLNDDKICYDCFNQGEK